MDDQFYRKLQSEKLLKKIANSAAKNKKRTVILILALLLFFYLLLDNKGILTRIRLERQQKEWVRRLQADSAETLRLQEQIKAYETNKDTLERIARERYGMTREGETVYQTKKKEE